MRRVGGILVGMAAASVLLVAFAHAQAPVFVAQWGVAGAGAGQFARPRGLAVDAQGHLYVCDSGNHRIQRFDLEGHFLQQWGTLGALDGQFITPTQIGLSPGGDVVVLDEGSREVQAFTSTGTFEHIWGQTGPMPTWLYVPRGLAVMPDAHVIVADPMLGWMMEYTIEGRLLSQWVPKWNGYPDYIPTLLTCGSAGEIVAIDNFNGLIRHISRSGDVDTQLDFLFFFSLSYVPIPPLGGIATDARGDLYVTDWKNCRVIHYSPNGALLASWGSPGSAPGQFNHPSGIAVDARGFVYVADTDNHRIQVFGDLATANHSSSWGALKAAWR